MSESNDCKLDCKLDHSIVSPGVGDPPPIPILGMGFVIAAIVGTGAAGICLLATHDPQAGLSTPVVAVQTLIYCVAVMCVIVGWSGLIALSRISFRLWHFWWSRRKKIGSPHTVKAICASLTSHVDWKQEITACNVVWSNGKLQIVLSLDHPTLRVEGLVLTEDEKDQIKMALDRMHAEKILSDGLNSKSNSTEIIPI